MIWNSLRLIGRWFRPYLWSLSLCLMTGLLCIAVTILIVWPAYQNPIARMYTSSLGYSNVIRKSGGSFPVSIASVRSTTMIGKFIGEGLVQSEPVQVPMVAMARILKVHVTEGQQIQAGDVVVDLDRSRLDMKIESARAAILTATSELKRVRLGTVNVLYLERPDVLALRAKSAVEESKFADQLLARNRLLKASNAISNVDFERSRLDAIRARLEQEESQIMTEAALRGRESSIHIAEAALREAELTLSHRLKQQEDYISLAPADGVVERVLVHGGEYNQDPGRPAVLLACGLWFECYLDQTSLGQIRVGDEVEVRLSAYQHRVFHGSVEAVRPLVNFALGGPETNRPIRPLGTGAPEWPSTFSIRVKLESTPELVVPGLTGYATVIQTRDVLAVPRGTVTAVSGNRGIVFVVGPDDISFEPRNVVVGIRDDRNVEIRSGLAVGERVIADGYQVLQPGDRIVMTGQDSNLSEPQ